MHVAVVGSGFSGVAVACQLLARLPAGSRLSLFNASGAMARGLAYGTQSDEHVLNVPAARMSLYPERPAHFLHWLQAQQGLELQGSDFVSRRLYGRYLQHCLEQAVREHPGVSLQQRVARIDRLQRQPDGRDELSWRPAADPRGLARECFDAVVLALGHFSPRPALPELASLGAALYANDPWDAQALAGLPAEAPLLLVGTGLTMLDVLLSLQRRGHRGPVLALSRRGLLPLGHRDNELPPPDWVLSAALLEPGLGLRERLHRLRAEVRAAVAAGHDWRDVFGALRAHTPALWQQLSLADRARFLRHLQVYWDVHRHRAAPAAIAQLQVLRASGQLQLHAGRLRAVEPTPDGRLRVRWTARGDTGPRVFTAARIVNCSGPGSRVDACSSPLLWQLQQQGELLPCPLGLGLRVDAQWHLLDAQGRSQPRRFYLGPLLRADYWEATAVPELRVHAQQLAETIVQSLALT